MAHLYIYVDPGVWQRIAHHLRTPSRILYTLDGSTGRRLLRLLPRFPARWPRPVQDYAGTSTCTWRTRRTTGTRSGPKSRRFSFGNFLSYFLLLHLLKVTAGVRVGENSPPSPGAVQLIPRLAQHAKHGAEAHHCLSQPAGKRAFQRAVRSAVQKGSAIYRGKQFTAAQFGIAPKTPEFKCKPPTSRRATRRLRCLCWNATGLSSESYVELRTWLKHHALQYDIVVITETWLKYNTEWEDRDWRFIHTGTEAGRGAGVLLIISRRIGGVDVRHRTLVEGRLLHARIRSRCPGRGGTYALCDQQTLP